MRDGLLPGAGFLLLVLLPVAAFVGYRQHQVKQAQQVEQAQQVKLAQQVSQAQALKQKQLAEAEILSSITMELVPADEEGKARVRVAGLTGDQAARLAAEFDPERWTEILTVRVADAPREGVPPMVGEYRLEGGTVVFEPRYPFKPGLRYLAELQKSLLPLALSGGRSVGRFQFALPAPRTAEAVIEQVYPTSDVLPENQLKFYIHFSAPMSRGEAYKRIHLVRSNGEEVAHPFLELGEELWNEDGTRFTLYFDPGRVKRGLKPREEVGPPLEAGESYALVIDREWRDENGRELAEGFRKEFRVTEPDSVPVDPQSWKLTVPRAGTREPFEAAFGEPLDHAMLLRVLAIEGADGAAVGGEVEVVAGETGWRFTPDRAWLAGQYRLVADTTLEDLAGNSINRPFEVDLAEPVQRPRTAERGFEVRE